MATYTTEFKLCEGSAGFEHLKVKDIAPATRQAIRQLQRLDDRHNVLLAGFILLWAIGAYMALTMPNPAVQIIACATIVSAIVALTVAMHEASHGLLFRNPTINDLAGLLCGLPVLIPLSAFRTNHRFHHSRRGSAQQPAKEAFDFAILRSLPVYCLGVLLKAYAFATVLPVIAIMKADSRTRLRIFGEYAIIIGAIWLVVRSYPFAAVWKIWILPLLIAAVVSQVRAIAEHGLTTKGNVFTASRTVVSNRLLSLLMCNINYHLEHHLFPKLPWYALPRAHRLLQAEYRRTGASVYQSYSHFFVDFLKATWLGIRPHARLISTRASRADSR